MSLFQRMTPAAIVLSGLLLGTAVPMRADRHHDCKKRIHRAEKELHRAIERHGEASPEADSRRHELDEIRERCGLSEHERHEELKEERHERHEEHEHGNY